METIFAEPQVRKISTIRKGCHGLAYYSHLLISAQETGAISGFLLRPCVFHEKEQNRHTVAGDQAIFYVPRISSITGIYLDTEFFLIEVKIKFASDGT